MIDATDGFLPKLQIMQQDLRMLRLHYPQMLAEQHVHDLSDALGALLATGAVDYVGITLVHGGRVYQELVYRMVAGGPEDESDRGRTAVPRLDLPAVARLVPWAVWTSSFVGLAAEKQRAALAETGWQLPVSAFVAVPDGEDAGSIVEIVFPGEDPVRLVTAATLLKIHEWLEVKAWREPAADLVQDVNGVDGDRED